VQAVTRTPDATDPHRSQAAIDQARDWAAQNLADLLAHSLVAATEEEEPTSTRNRFFDWWSGLLLEVTLIPHLEALAEHTDPSTETAATEALFCRAAQILQRDTSLAQANPPSTQSILLLERTLAACARVQGDDHPDTLGTRTLLALAYQSAGDLARAIPLLERTIADCAQVIGDDHSLTRPSAPTSGQPSGNKTGYRLSAEAGREN
jgi:Tetratricopeptide repeat